MWFANAIIWEAAVGAYIKIEGQSTFIFLTVWVLELNEWWIDKSVCGRVKQTTPSWNSASRKKSIRSMVYFENAKGPRIS